MEKLFSLEYGIGGICVLLTVMVLLRVAEFLWAHHKRIENVSEETTKALIKAVQENTAAIRILELRLTTLESSLFEVSKMKTDLRRFYAAIKELAGDKWPAIRDEITKDGFPS